MTNFDSQVSELRDIVRKLAATGENGFEGLMAAVLTDITKTSFGLAKSGSQRGKDGQSVLNAGVTSFEGKLYKGRVPKNEVLSKIAEIAADDDGEADLWILGSTGTVSTQDVNTVAALGERLAIMTLILDWAKVGLPAFATLLAMAPATAASFLAPRTGVTEQDILAKLVAVRQHTQFNDRARELNAAIEQPSLGPAYALKRNEEWLRKAFASTGRARAVFGQPLAPADPEIPGVVNRSALHQSLSKTVFGKPNGAVAGILGADGNGKSWLFAQAWMHQSPKCLAAVLVPDDIKSPFSLDSLEELLISTLIIQTGDSPTEKSEYRWRKHFDRWKRLKSHERPRLVVFMDGVNQRESVHWRKFIDSMSQALADLGGKLVFSCRTPFFGANLKGRLVAPIEAVEVPAWSNPELELLLAERGTSIANLSPAVVEFLRNPRIFAVAAELFKNRQIERFTELSVSRLLFEHIRTGASPVADPMSAADLVWGVRQHADEIVKRLQQTQTRDLTVFDRSSGPGQSPSSLSLAEQFAITSAGRFFEALPEDPKLYTLKDDGLPLALGLSLLGAARRARRNGLNIEEELAKILDPISALDNTADVLISALVAAVLGDGSPDDIVAALVTAFTALQNLDAARYEEFRSLSRRAPTAFLKALENAALAEGITSNLSWLTQALLEGRKEADCSHAIVTFVHRWLSMYSPAPERMVMTPHSAGSVERAKEWQKRKDAIDAKLGAFSPTEKVLLDSLVLEERGDYTRLNKVAFQLEIIYLTPFLGSNLLPWAEITGMQEHG